MYPVIVNINVTDSGGENHYGSLLQINNYGENHVVQVILLAFRGRIVRPLDMITILQSIVATPPLAS